MAITYIVVTENHRWGRSDELMKAFENAGLKAWHAVDFFCDSLEVVFDLGTAERDWLEYGRDEYKLYEEPVQCVIYAFDPTIWADWHVSSIDGGVTFFRPAEEPPGIDYDKAFKQAAIKANWINGRLAPRT